MGQNERRPLKAVGVDRVGVILRGDLDSAGLQVPYRVIAAAVAELELVGLGSVGQGDDLVSETDAESDTSQELPNGFDGLGTSSAVTGTVGEEEAVRRSARICSAAVSQGDNGHVQPGA